MICKIRQAKSFAVGAAIGMAAMGAALAACRPELRKNLRRKGKRILAAVEDWYDDMF